MADLDRDELLATLSRLSDDDDATAAEAGRAAAAMIAEAGLGWPDVIVAAQTLAAAHSSAEPDAEAAAEPDAEAAAEAEPGNRPPIDAAANGENALVLIDHLLARKTLYQGTRDDLLAYKEDIASGEFGDADMTYLNALYARVVLGKGKGKAGD